MSIFGKILNSCASIFDPSLLGTYFESDTNQFVKDKQNIYNDWCQVGQYISNSMAKFDLEDNAK
jgi:hypothetical protein